MADRVGHIEVGMIDDLVALDGNLLEDIESLRRVKMVMQNGVLMTGVLGGTSDVFGD